MAGYKWAGTPEPKPVCGSRQAYQGHLYRGEEACDPCKAANAEYSAAWAAVKRPRRPQSGFTTDKCGTFKGHAAHKYHGVPLCDPCKEAGRAYHREYKAAKRAA